MCLSWRVDTPQTKPDRELIVSTSNDGVANVPYRQERRAQRGSCGRLVQIPGGEWHRF